MKEREKKDTVGYKSFWLILGVNFNLIILLFADDAVFVTTGDDRRLRGALQRIFIALCDLGVAFLPDLFFFFPFFHEFWKAVNFILRHCTVDQSCKYFTSTKKNQTICFVVSQIKHFLLFSWWLVEIICASTGFVATDFFSFYIICRRM